MKKSRILIAIPCFNEAASIGSVLEKTLSWASINVNQIDVVVFNDGSTDGTLKIVQDHTQNIVNLPFNVGISQVFQLASRIASELEYDYLAVIDGDGQHPISEVAKLLEKADPSKYLIGTRNFQTYPFSQTKRVAINIIRMLLQVRFQISIKDPTSGLRLIPKKCFDQIQNLKDATNYLEDTVLILPLLRHADVRCVEVEVEMNLRTGGESSSTGVNNLLNYLSLLSKLITSKKVK